MILSAFAAGIMTAASVWSLIIPALEQSAGLGRFAFLQWGTETIKGINGQVDSNLCYVDYPEVIRKSGKNYLSDRYLVRAEKSLRQRSLSRYRQGLKGWNLR